MSSASSSESPRASPNHSSRHHVEDSEYRNGSLGYGLLKPVKKENDVDQESLGFGGFTMRRHAAAPPQNNPNDVVLPSPRQLEEEGSLPPTPTTATRASFMPPPILPSFALGVKRKHDRLGPLPSLSNLELGNGRPQTHQYQYMPPMSLHPSANGPPPAKRRSSAIDLNDGHFDLFDSRRHSIASGSLPRMRGDSSGQDDGEDHTPSPTSPAPLWPNDDYYNRRRDSAASFYSSNTSFGGSTNGSVTTFSSESNTQQLPRASPASQQRSLLRGGPQLPPLLSHNGNGFPPSSSASEEAGGPSPLRTGDSGNSSHSMPSFSSAGYFASQANSPTVENYDGLPDSAHSSNGGHHPFMRNHPLKLTSSSSNGGSPISPAFHANAPLRRMSVPDIPITAARRAKHPLHLNTGADAARRRRSPSNGRLPPLSASSSNTTNNSPSPLIDPHHQRQPYTNERHTQQQQQQHLHNRDPREVDELMMHEDEDDEPRVNAKATAAQQQAPTSYRSASSSGSRTAGEGADNDGAGGGGTSPGSAAGPYSRTPELRVSHKLAERKRRKEMKELFDELRESLPADRGMKASKWEILTKAVDFINQLKDAANERQDELEQLRRENTMFRAQAAQSFQGNGASSASRSQHFRAPSRHEDHSRHNSRPSSPRNRRQPERYEIEDEDQPMADASYRSRPQNVRDRSPDP